MALSFKNKPLREVLDELAKLAAVNLHLDPEGLAAEAVDPSTPVNIELTHEISLKSALNLILQPLHLGYVIKDEVLKITSEQLKDGEIYPVTYNVADLVIPIPNFVPNGRLGLSGSLADAMSQSMSAGGVPGFGASNLTSVVASHDGAGGKGVVNPAVLAQMAASGTAGGGPINQPNGFSPGGMGGGNQADFDSLIQLITSTIKPTSWDEVGGPGSIAEFRTNLSLVISQTQDIHAEIADLLSQLRRLQDLQVTIEVRFITLNDNFFEQIGVDFNFNIENLDKNSIDVNGHPTSPGATVGLTSFTGGVPTFTSNLDIPFTDNSFTLATPQFGQPTNVASFGFAHPERYRSIFPGQCLAGRSAEQCNAGPQGHAVQWSAGFRLRHVANSVRDQRDSGGRRFRGGPAAGDRRAQRRHLPHRAGGGVGRSAVRAAHGRAVLQPDRQCAGIHLPRLEQLDELVFRRRQPRCGGQPVGQQLEPIVGVEQRHHGAVAHVLLCHGARPP